MNELLLQADKALANLIRGFQEGMGNPNDLEDALQIVQDAKNELLALTQRVRKAHDTNKVKA